MKMVEHHSPVHSSTTEEGRTYGMEFNKKAYTILSSGLYKYKIRAFIRELSCNAIDGHKALELAGGSPPKYFDVTLPSILDLQWKLRDYGIGLDKENIFRLFATYFASSKDQSDDFIGAFGLGSKSPFCYTTNFTVTSYFNGTKTVYSIYMNDGEPNCVPVFEGPSDEPTGVEIVIPVKEDDIPTFIKESQYVYFTFDKNGYYPNYKGMSIDLLNYKDWENNDCSSPELYKSGVYAVMGGVPYEIPRDVFENTLAEIFFPPHAKRFVDFPMGSVNMLPNREELSLDKHTMETLKSYFQTYNDQVIKMVDQAIEGQKDARAKINAIKKLDQGNSIFSKICNDIFHNGKSLKDWEKFYNSFELSSPWLRYLSLVKDDPKNKDITTYRTSGMGTTNGRIYNRKRAYHSSRYSSDAYTYVMDSFVDPRYNQFRLNAAMVLIDTDARGYRKKLKKLHEEGYINNGSMIVFNTNHYNKRISKIVKDVFVEIAKRYHKDDIEVVDANKVWEKYGPDIIAREKELQSERRKEWRKNNPVESRAGKPNVKYHSPNTGIQEIYCVSKDIKDLSGYYVGMIHGHVVDSDETQMNLQVEDYILAMVSDILKENVFKLNKVHTKQAEKNKNLKRLDKSDISKIMQSELEKQFSKDKVGYFINDLTLHNYTEEIISHFKLSLKKDWDGYLDRLFRYCETILPADYMGKYGNIVSEVKLEQTQKITDFTEKLKKDHIMAYTLMTTKTRNFSYITIDGVLKDEINKNVLGDDFPQSK
ncbi:rIIA protector from prophage-induced early lysis [Aeromonas phage Aswh_1]|nr:rIIA protector from prophage-induced early lysis [Aeromonas phage Aswh_1]